MERRVNSLLSKLICLLMVMGVASARPTVVGKVPNTKANYYGERLRRNLLANGLGSTPPMGY